MSKGCAYKDPVEENDGGNIQPPSECPFCHAPVEDNWTWVVRYACDTIGYKGNGKFGKNCNGNRLP